MSPQVLTAVVTALCVVAGIAPLGTNLALVQVLWALVSGQVLAHRGAVLPAVAALGLPMAAVYRAWAAVHHGAWQVADMLPAWAEHVEGQGDWQPLQAGPYQVVPVDLTAFWRPSLQNCVTKHYHAAAGKALPALPFGLIGRAGQVGSQRVTVLRAIVRPTPRETKEKALRQALLKELAATLQPSELPVLDAGFPLAEVQAAGLQRCLVRVAKNATFRRNTLPPYAGHGRPAHYGTVIRPLARTSGKGKTLPATPADAMETWTLPSGEVARADFWYNVVRPDQPVDQDNALLTVICLTIPSYPDPWLLVCFEALSGEIAYVAYTGRWPIEQVPLCAKQMLGTHRQFVFADEARWRWPELALLTGTVLTYVAARAPATPTGFWDRRPRPTPGRLRRVLARVPFLEVVAHLPANFRKKAATTTHLPKGIAAHRRQPAVAPP